MNYEHTRRELEKTVLTNMSFDDYVKGENIPHTDTFEYNLTEHLWIDYVNVCVACDYERELDKADVDHFVRCSL